MVLRFQYLLLAILAVVFLCSDVTSAPSGGGGQTEGKVGGWQRVDPTDEEVVELAKFAIDKHNYNAGIVLLYETTAASCIWVQVQAFYSSNRWPRF
ncbi:hypothetical protein ACH5RR_014696 [Cinchona calisaya]|uniref:Cysteine proteinase inhibitor n=1 Tax=Cinchona calisaya TaxID=153742 RepID=A0ABD2ZR18_9GENT